MCIGSFPEGPPSVAGDAVAATVRPKSSLLSTLGQPDHDGPRQLAARLILLGAPRGGTRLRLRPRPRLLTATSSRWASRRCKSAHPFGLNSLRTLAWAWAQSGRATSRALLPLAVSLIALMRPSGCGTRSVTP